jgi:3-deoxy-D-manno-octulosonic-acid transferase
MKFLYNLSVKIYHLIIVFVSPFNIKASKMIKGRYKWELYLKQNVNQKYKYIWFHVSSLGEFEQARPLIELIKKNNPNKKILLSFFSPSGYEIRKNYEFADIICYLPFDTKSNAKKFISIVKPEMVIFVKYDFWYHYITEVNNKKIPLFLISAIFRDSQIFFKSYGNFYRDILKCFNIIFLQNNESQLLLKKFNINNTYVCGDTRIDRVIDIAKQTYYNTYLENFFLNNFVVIAGSTWAEDEELLRLLINDSDFNIKLIIAPHEVDKKNITRLIDFFGKNCVALSNIDSYASEPDVILIDSIGLLSKIYRFSKLAYIGGGFGKGIHNILEPAVYGIPIFFGPNNKKFQEAQEFKQINAAHEITNYKELKTCFIDYYNNDLNLNITKKNLINIINKSSGATEFIYKKINEFD